MIDAPVLAQPDAPVLVSWLKPLLMLAVLIGWGWIISEFDKDAQYYNIKNRYWWNLAHVLAAVVGVGLMLVIPIFLLGFVAGLAVIVGEMIGYVFYRNPRVPSAEHWTFDLDTVRRFIEDYERTQAFNNADIVLIDEDNDRQDIPGSGDPMAEAHSVLEDLANFALTRNAHHLQINIGKRNAEVVVEIDGVQYPQDPLDPTLATQVMDYLKAAANLVVDERRKKQSGLVWVDAHELGTHRFSIETSGSTRGITLNVSIDPKSRATLPLKSAGLTAAQHEQLKQLSEIEGGVVLISAPQGHGQTTTLCSVVELHDPYTTTVAAIQSREVCELEAISYYPPPQGASPQECDDKLGTIMRTEPHVVLLPEFYTDKTAQKIAQNTEHTRFYVGVHEADTFQALRRWVKLIGDRRTAANSLQAVVAQRLVRRLCPTCRTAYTPEPAALKKLNLPAKRIGQLYHASGQVIIKKNKPEMCPACYGLGYRGRIGVFEIMMLDDEARQYISDGQSDRLRAHLRKNKMIWLQESALGKIVEGITDIQEVTRVLGENKPPSDSNEPDTGQAAPEKETAHQS